MCHFADVTNVLCPFRFSHSNSESKFAIWETQGDTEEQRALSPLPQGIHQWIWQRYEDGLVEFIHGSQTGKLGARLPVAAERFEL